ncbi:MAG: phosphate signaling complex protein PhoU [Acidimicrobiales bacterium]|nr:phosphate signaling complex protein PhoU [Acidimicrobiales bacterium]
MADQRSHFHSELDALESSILGIAERADHIVGTAVDALVNADVQMAAAVSREGAALAEVYVEAHTRWLNLMALQQPMGSDLRMMSALLHLNVTLERTAAQCVNIAELARLARGLPTSDRIIRRIEEMADLVRPMIRTAVHAFQRRDPDEARLLPAMDEPVDEINRAMYREVVDCAPDERLIEWATHMMMAARALERIGDQAVDIGEQVVFLISGEYHGFSDEGITGRS